MPHADGAFCCCRQYEPIVSLFASKKPSLPSVFSTKARRDFSEELYDSCVRDGASAKKAYSSSHATWFPILRAALTLTDTSDVSREQWVGALSAAMLTNRIECVPGCYNARLSYRRVIRLVGYTPSALVTMARPGSLKRAAIEAECRAEGPAKRRAIDFGCSIPFTEIPQLVEDGFRLQEKHFKRGDRKVLEHYQIARHCLEQCLGDPLCDVMLMLVLTVASSSVTPSVAPKSRVFEPGQRKDPKLLAANLVTRMLWFLRPQHFPWEKDEGSVLRIPEMTKKIGRAETPS